MAWIDIKDYTQDSFPILNYSNGLAPKAGMIYQYAGFTAPDGFLMCDGSDVSRTTYAELFAVIGTTYGAGDGSTTFNVPNLCGRVGIGADGTYALGSSGGEAEHTLTVDELAEHDHDRIIYSGNDDWTLGDNIGMGGYQQDAHSVQNQLADYADNYVSLSHYRTSYSGGNQPHNNMQPYLTINYIISTGQGGLSAAEIVGGISTLPLGIENGGTGATSKETALQGLGVEDYVVAEGVSGDWTWRKWNSGVAECWGYASGNLSYYDTVNNFYFMFMDVVFPFVFKDNLYYLNHSWVHGSQHAIASTQLNRTVNGCTLFAMTPSSATLSSVCFVKVIGRWK